MKWLVNRVLVDALRRSPCGERGLKYVVDFPLDIGEVSLPVRGAWIEIVGGIAYYVMSNVAPRAGSVD